MGFSSTSNRPRRQLHHILHHHQLFLQKRLSILYPNQISVSPRQQIHLRIQLINRQVNALLPFAFCWPELRPIRQNRFASRLILFRNVDNKTRRHPLERSRIQNLERPVWRALNRQLLQPRQKTSFVSKCGSMIVIRMPRLPVRQYHRSRPPLPNHRRQPQLMLPRWLHIRIRYPQIPPPRNPQNFRRQRRLFRARLAISPRPHLTFCQIQNPGLVSLLGHLQQRSSTRQLHVIRMRRNR